MSDFKRRTYRIDDLQFPVMQISYDGSSNVEYIGWNTNIDAADGDTSWKVTKYSYTSGDIVKRKTKEGVSWTNRAAAF